MVKSVVEVAADSEQTGFGKRAWTPPSITDEDARSTAQSKTGGHEATVTLGIPS